jgi:arylsulfatase A-like enzyme
VLWGDHGWKLGEHNSWAKMTNFEVDARAPLIFRAPGQGARGIQIGQMVEFVDIYPTLCELAGLPLPDHLQGISTVPLMEDPSRSWKSAVFTQFLREGIWVAPDGIEYMGYSMRTDQYRYTVWQNWETKQLAARELYDHSVDPDEDSNVAERAEYAMVVAELESRREAGWPAALPSRSR